MWSLYDIGPNISIMRPENRRDFISSITHNIARSAYYNLPQRLRRDFETAFERACIGVELIGEVVIDYHTSRAKLEKSKTGVTERYSKESLNESSNFEASCVDLAREGNHFIGRSLLVIIGSPPDLFPAHFRHVNLSRNSFSS